MDPNQPVSPLVPAVQKPSAPNSNSMLTALSDALNPRSAAALATVEQNIQAASPTPAPEPAKPETPAAIPPAAPATVDTAKPEAPTQENKPLKKGFDSLDVDTETPAAPESGEGETEVFPAEVDTPEKKTAWSGIQKDIRTLKKEKAVWEAEKARLTAEAAKAKQFTEADPEYQKYLAAQKRLEEVEPIIARVAYQKTPAYREAITEPMNQIGQAAQALAKQYEIADDRMLAALQEPDRKRQAEMLDEVSENMNSLDKTELFTMANGLRRLYSLDEQMSQKAMQAQQEAEGIEAKKAEQAGIERKAAEMRAITDSRTKLMKVASAFKVGSETEEQAVNAILEAANATPFAEHSTEDGAFAVISAQLVPRFMQNIRDLQAKLAAKEKYIADMSAANPRAAAGQQAQVNGTLVPKSLMDGLAADMAKLGIR